MNFKSKTDSRALGRQTAFGGPLLFAVVTMAAVTGCNKHVDNRSVMLPPNGGESVSDSRTSTTATSDGTAGNTVTDTNTGSTVSDGSVATTTESNSNTVTSNTVTKRVKRAKPLSAEEREKREGTYTKQDNSSTTEVMPSEEQDELQSAFARAKREEHMCPDPVHGHAEFMRPDLAYSVNQVDCFGDIPKDFTAAVDLPHGTMRSPASVIVLDNRNHTGTCDGTDKHAHALWDRPDLAYSVTGEDCVGDLPADRRPSLKDE